MPISKPCPNIPDFNVYLNGLPLKIYLEILQERNMANNFQTFSSELFPEVTFSAFLMSLASSALVGLGEAPDPQTGKVSKNLALAHTNIDMLELLRQKTKGNLDEKENALLENLLCDLRLKFVMNTNKKSNNK